jgi:hypothetical protein
MRGEEESAVRLGLGDWGAAVLRPYKSWSRNVDAVLELEFG